MVLPTEARTGPTRITVDVAPTFVPGPADSRTLGMILDEVRLVPDGLPSPPSRAVTAAATAGAIVAAMIVLLVRRRRGRSVCSSASSVAQGLALVDRRRAVHAPLSGRRSRAWPAAPASSR